MKVSITFDKDIKQSNKKLWVKQIQTVVDRLNNQNRQSIQINSQCQSPVNSHTKIISNLPTSKAISEFSCQRQSELNNGNFDIIQELVCMQKMMEQKFCGITRCISKLSEKVINVEKRLIVLEEKQQLREQKNKDFDREFAEIALKYQKMDVNSKQKESCFNDVETCDTGFSFVRY